MHFPDLEPHFIRTPPFTEWPARFADYLLTRGVTPAQVLKWGIGYVEEGDLRERVYLPIEDRAGTLRTFAARSILPVHNQPFTEPVASIVGDSSHPFWHRWSYQRVHDLVRPPTWFGERFWPRADSQESAPAVVVCEGTFDALAIERATPDLPVAAFHYCHMPFQGYDALTVFPRVLLVTDADAGGGRIAQQVERGLAGRVPVTRVLLPAKDPAVTPTPTLRECILQALC